MSKTLDQGRIYRLIKAALRMRRLQKNRDQRASGAEIREAEIFFDTLLDKSLKDIDGIKTERVIQAMNGRSDSDFYSGIISALAIVKLHGEDTIFEEIVALCDLPSLLAHAEAEDEIDFAGLSRLYEEWKYKGPI